MGWDKKVIKSTPWCPMIWEDNLVKEVIENNIGHGHIVAVQSAYQMETDEAVMKLIHNMAMSMLYSSYDKNIVIVEPHQSLQKKIRETFCFDISNKTSIRLRGVNMNIIFADEKSLKDGAEPLRGAKLTAIIINDADYIDSNTLYNFVNTVGAPSTDVIMFGGSRENSEKKSAWLYYLNHPMVNVYLVDGSMVQIRTIKKENPSENSQGEKAPVRKTEKDFPICHDFAETLPYEGLVQLLLNEKFKGHE